MKIEIRRLMWGVVACAAALMPAVMHAQGTTCTNAIPVVTDGRNTGLHTYFIGANTSQWFTVTGAPNSSFSVEIFDPFDSGGNLSVPTIFANASFNQGTCTGTALTVTETTGSQPPVITFNTAPFAGRRVSFTATAFQDYFVQITSGATAFFYTISATETTLFNPNWSTFGGFQTFYKFYNTTSRTCTVVVTLQTDTNTTPLGGTNTATIVIPPGQTSATRNTGTTDLNLNAQQTGHAFITNNCPPGAIQVDGFLGNFSGAPVVLPIKIVAARATH